MLLCGITSLCSAQFSSDFDTFKTQTCLTDSTKKVKTISKWMAYQTTDGTWFGPIDSTRCISMKDTITGQHAELDLEQLDPNEPLYVRYRFDGDYPLLPSDTVLSLSAYTSFSTGLPIETSTGCSSEVCTGLQLGIEIPDSSGTGKTTRMYNLPSSSSYGFSIDACIPTESFKENRLKEFILKFTFKKNAKLKKHWIRFYNAQLETPSPNFDLLLVKNPIVAESYYANNNTYNLAFYKALPYVSSFQAQSSFLLKYDPINGYPSQAHPTHIDVALAQNKPTVQTINLHLYGASQLVAQPYTSLRGQLVEGSDSLRHIVNLINNGGSICMAGWFGDLPFGRHTNYIHESGRIELGSTKTCLLFRDSAMLKVVENATLRYGENGVGMLALQSGARIILEKNATLHLNNALMLKEMNDQGFSAPVSVDLQQGARLIFSEMASVNALHSSSRLYVYMNGGTLDDSRLSASSKALIQRIYPTPDQNLSSNISVAPNPMTEECTINYLAADVETITLTLHSAQGNLLQQEHYAVQKGWNKIAYHIENQVTGCCFLTLKAGSQQAVKKIMVLR